MVTASLRQTDYERGLGAFRAHPADWAEVVLGVTVYPHQRRIMNAIARAAAGEGKRRVAVRSCNSAGKDFALGAAVLWAPSAYPGDIRVVTTAPTWDQLEQIVWGREIRRLYQGARVGLGGRLLDTEWDISATEQALALSTRTKEALQGRHAGRLFVFVSEASGEELDDGTWEAIDSLMSSGEAVLVAVGNPTRPQGYYRDIFYENSADWETIQINAFETPNLLACMELDGHDPADWERYVPRHQVPAGCRVIEPALITHEWVEDIARMRGADSSYYRMHVLAEFVEEGQNNLIPLAWVEAALHRLRHGSDAPRVAGLDVARHGMDQTAICVLNDADLVAAEAWSERNLMASVGRVLRYIEGHQIRVLAIDDTNMHGVSDRLIEAAAEQRLDLRVIPVNWSSRAHNDKAYHNKPSEMWAALRDNLNPEAPQPLSLAIGDKETARLLQAQLTRATFTHDSYGMGRLWVQKAGESDDSPDLADALALAVEAWQQLYHAGPQRRVYRKGFA